MQPLVSIILPSYNKERYVAETVNSIIEQTYDNWELIIIDDVSTDSTLNVIRSFSSIDKRIKLFINNRNKGANYSRNFGLKKALGEYVIFLDADDILSSKCLAKRVEYIRHDNLDFCVFTMGTFLKSRGDQQFLWAPTSKDPLIDFFNHQLPWSILQPIWKLSFLLYLTGFDEKFPRLQDVELHTRALLVKGVKYDQIVAEPDCFYRIDDDRKNFNAFNFLEKWIDSCLLYYDKFYDIAKEKKKNNYLLGTIYKAYLQILLSYKNSKITHKEFSNLKTRLFNQNLTRHLNLKAKICFRIAHSYNLMPIRIPGINFLINKMLII